VNAPCKVGDFIKVGRTVAFVDDVIPLAKHGVWTGRAEEGETPTDWNVIVYVTKPGKKTSYVGQPTSFKPSLHKIEVI